MIKKIYKFIWDKLGWFFIGGICLASTIIPTTPTIDIEVENKMVEISDVQSQYVLENGKYKYIPKQQLKDTGITYKVDEYVVWKGEGVEPDIGYIISFEKEKGSKKVNAKGVKSNINHDWDTPEIIIEEAIASTTTK